MAELPHRQEEPWETNANAGQRCRAQAVWGAPGPASLPPLLSVELVPWAGSLCSRQ